MNCIKVHHIDIFEGHDETLYYIKMEENVLIDLVRVQSTLL
jgi:hypothetical protein